MRYSTVFLDLDDTLIDTVQNTKDTVKEIYEDYNIGKYFSSFEDFYVNTFRPNNLHLWHEYEHQRISKNDLIRNRFVKVFESIDEISEKDALDINTDYLRRIVKRCTLIPGCIEILEYLKPKYKLCILSNGFTELQYDKIDNAGLNDFFDEILLSDKIGINKPQRGIFEYAMKQMNTPSDKAIMVGDNFSSDIVGAYAAKIDQIWYNPRKIENTDFAPTHTIEHLNELKNIL